MIAVKPADVSTQLREYMDLAFSGEPVIVSGKDNRNVIIISECEYNEMLKAKRNSEYLAKLDKSLKQLENGEVIVKSMEELESMADE